MDQKQTVTPSHLSLTARVIQLFPQLWWRDVPQQSWPARSRQPRPDSPEAAPTPGSESSGTTGVPTCQVPPHSLTASNTAR